MGIVKRKRKPQNKKNPCIKDEKFKKFSIHLNAVETRLSEIERELRQLSKEIPALIKEYKNLGN